MPVVALKVLVVNISELVKGGGMYFPSTVLLSSLFL